MKNNKRTHNASQSDTHLAKATSNMGVARNSQPKAELLQKEACGK